jgi:hypothetical protein
VDGDVPERSSGSGGWWAERTPADAGGAEAVGLRVQVRAWGSGLGKIPWSPDLEGWPGRHPNRQWGGVWAARRAAAAPPAAVVEDGGQEGSAAGASDGEIRTGGEAGRG